MATSKLENAQALLAAGKLEQARAALQRLLQSDPRDPAANDLMRAVLVAQGKIEQALFFAQRALAGAPDHAGAMADCGAILGTLGKHAEAITLLSRAVKVDPRSRQGHFALVASLLSLERTADAEAAARAGLAALPGDRELLIKQAAALLNLGQADRAMVILSSLLFEDPDDRAVAESIATIANYDPASDRARVFAAHKNFGRLLQQTDLAAPYRHEPRPTPAHGAARKLRLGILSPDLRQHSVGFFIEPVMEHLDRSRFELFVYDTSRRPDGVTQRLRAHPGTWRVARALNPAQLATGIHADKLDVVVELSGLTAGHSLEALRRKPAPVQATYLGFPNTTGLPSMDYRIVDSLTDPGPPSGDADAFATERLVRLDPCFLCYRPPGDAPPPRTARSGPITFGCFNALTKINDPLLALWSRLLAIVPDSRLLIKARELCSPDVREHLAQRCRAAGLAPDRLEIAQPTVGLADHLALYHRVDVALDTFPYHGTTTTCEALWMGVPVVTLVGDRHASRVGLSLLTCVGRAGWCAGSADEYVHLATTLAAQAQGDAPPGGTDLRKAMAGSPLCDGPRFARRFERVIESMLGA